jgi:hypothetical protein
MTRKTMLIGFLFVGGLFQFAVLRAAESSAEAQWKAFLARPSASTFDLLSETIRNCVQTKCRDADVAGSEDNFANLYKVLALTERGNRYAMEVAFLIRPIYENHAAEGEDIDKSLGLSATVEPTRFLELLQKFKITDELLNRYVSQTSWESVDNTPAQISELKRRRQAFLAVRDTHLLPLRDKAISVVERDIAQLSPLTDSTSGK